MKLIIITPETLSVCINPDASVGLIPQGVGKVLGLTEDTSLVVRMSPQETRDVAALLIRKAEEAEARIPQRDEYLHAPSSSRH